MEWESLFNQLKAHVRAGEVTTYRELALWAYNHAHGTQAIVAMLKAAVNADVENAVITNRVVPVSGKLANVNGQTAQLKDEGISIVHGIVDWSTTPVVKIR